MKINKKGILGLVGAGAALLGFGLFKMCKKDKEVVGDDWVSDDESIDVDDYEVTTEESED